MDTSKLNLFKKASAGQNNATGAGQKPPVATAETPPPDATKKTDAEQNPEIERLKKQIAQKQARLVQLQQKEKAKARKDDAHYMILFAAALLNDLEKHPQNRAGIEGMLKRGTTKEKDKAVLRGRGWGV